ncbi:uncharacterized protein LOC110276728 [Arachis duranensis]|uniref:Uncharacterized protein LOC110276728 n=1 Tax=Arachis duranensis TaxID=130453 RepID=A0A6P5N0U0_ARADU|nr:uncharacterized protein LOC110276728 [Arachis duranensis]
MEFLVALATGVVTKLGESLVAPITNQFAYIIRYKRNVKNLESQRKELEGKKLGVQATVDADKRNSHQIASNVEGWLCKVDTIENELQGFYEDDEQVKNKYLNLVSCYSLSKRAKKLSNDIIRLKEEKFEIISYPKPPPRLGSRFLNGTSIKSFQTRESIMCEVIDKLKDEDVNRISICGMGGVGKTTFVKEVIKILEADKSFDEVVMAVVSQTPDCRKIQGQIADAIGLKLDKETDQGRALQLHDRLKNIDSVLIVLDDVWTDLDFESIGIPSTSCKILFTSRIQDVCIKMKSQRNFTVSVLSRDESWDLFNETIGVNLAEKPDIHDIAKEIANQCRGLPIAIVTIAKALANKEKHAWEDALEQLRNSSVESFPEMQTSVFSCIELSYNFLGGEEKFFLFLCSLLPEDFDIPIEVLFRHGVGLGMFKGIDALWKVRNRVHTIVDRLKECFMLLDSNVEECVKMHDVVRDTIASIAAKYHHHLECYSSAISLIFEKKTELPHVSNCQKLKLLQVSSKGKESVPENFFQGMNKLMVLSLQNVLIQSMPSTLSALDNIHTLRLEACNVGDISIIGQKLMKLEILSFAKSSIKVLPLEIGQLTLLRLLDLTECNHLIQISATVLASLSRLEELYLRVRNFPSKESNHILFELQCLSHQLKVLEFAFIMVDEYLPKDLIFKNVVRFWVYVGDSSTISHGLVPRGYLHPNVLTLNNTYYSYIKKSVTIQHFLQRVEILSLDDIKNLKCVISDLDEEGFPLLKNLIIESCNNLEYAADSCDDHCVFPQVQSISLRNLENLKAIICHVAHHLCQKVEFSACQCFGSLQVLKIEYCKSLKTIFTLLFPRRTTSLAKLQCLHVVESHGIECIVSINTIKVDDSIIVFSNLVELKLQELPNLTAFIKTSIMHQHHSPYKVQESNTLLENFIEHDQEFLGEDMSIGSALFESNSLQLFPKLEKILLRACSSLNIVFDMKPSQLEDQHVDNAAFFAQLKELELSWLNNLNHIWGSVPSNIQGFHKLKSIKVANCDSLKYIFTPSIVRALTQLEKLVIQSCMSLEKFVGNEQGQHVETLVFVQLESLTLKDLPQLVNFGANSYMILWPAMKSLCIDGCPLLKASNVCVQEENFNVISNSTTTHDVGTTTSMEDSPSLRFLQCCFGGTKELLVSNSKAKALKMEEGVVDAKEINFFNEMGGSPMPILEHVIIKGWDSLDVLFHLKQSEDSNNTIVVNCLVKLMTMQLPSSPLGVIAFNNITLLSLEACHRLRYICSYSIAKLLVKLQEIKVSNCKVVEQLFQSEEHEICVDYLEWPSLKRISVINCSMLEVVISKVEEGKINSFIITSFAQLQSLTLTHLPNVISFCNNTFLENGHGNEYFKQDHERASSSEEERNTRLDAPLINGFQFPNLRHIAIMGCNKMSCLFSPSTSKSLVHLQVLEICGCGDIEEIVSFEDTNKVMSVISNKFVFHNLQHLKLENLPKLKAFCKGSYDFDFPLLHEVFLKNCHMMEIFSCGSSYTPKLDKVTMEIGNVAKNIWMGDLNATMPLCKGMLTFQSSETLRWIKQHSWALRYLTKEKELTIEGFQRLLNLVPSNVMHLFQNLNQLTIKDCDSLVEVFESQGIIMMNKKEVTNYELQSMSLQHLPKLTHIWRFHGGVLGFKKLRVLKVEHCGSLCSLFSPSMAKTLVQLWHLRVHNCHMMEEIIEESSSSSSSNEDKIIVFPLLNKLELRHLTNFKCFSSQRNLDIELPSCEEMVIEKCPNMTSFCYGDVKTPKLLQIYKGSYEYVDLMVDLNATIHCANKNFKVPQQTLERSRFIEQDHHLLDYLRSQTELFVEDSETLLHCVPFNMFHRFQHIKQLKVRECGSIVEIFESKSNGDDDDDDEGYCCTKTFYNYNMQELHLYALPKLMHIWRENHGRILTFGNLRKLKIGFCGGLKSLLSPSIARGLSQLQEFSVHECEELEKIISDEESIHNVKIIEFPSLQWLTLYQLPSLGCFCSSSYHFELPSCHDIIIKECPKIEACCKGITKTFQN